MNEAAVFHAATLVVTQKVKVITVTSELTVSAEDGTALATVTEVGQTKLRKALRVATRVTHFLRLVLEVRDPEGALLFRVTRMPRVLRSTVVVALPSGDEVGRIMQETAFGKIRFGIFAAGTQIAELQAENWRAWDFAVVDDTGTEVARIKRTFEGLAKTLFTSADSFVAQVHRPLADPLRTLVIASVLTIDSALKPDTPGRS